MDLKKIMEYFKKGNNNQLSNIIVVCLVGVLLIIAASFFKDNSSFTTLTNKNAKNSTSDSQDSSKLTEDTYRSDQENKLKSLLQSIQGVGSVQVMIYFDTGEEQVPAINQNSSTSVINEVDNSGGKRTTSQSNSSNTVVITNNGDKSEPLIIQTNKPKVNGVLIVAEGAEDSNVKFNITNSVAELFNIPENKVNVFPMKK